MFNVVLYQPEIPPNTGNIIRLCVNTGCALHLIEPLGFDLSDKQLKRAGLDYKLSTTSLRRYPSFESYLEINLQPHQNSRIFLCSTKARTTYSSVNFQKNDSFVFGPETRGLPNELLLQYPENQKLIIPMQSNVRSINLSNAVAVVVYEAWRQNAFTQPLTHYS